MRTIHVARSKLYVKIGLLILSIFVTYFSILFAPNIVISEVRDQNVYISVKRVIDGDTIVLSNGEKIRLIGVDTPETVHPKKPVEYFGQEASQFTKKMCEGKKVRLESDQNTRDKYGRRLAYIYLEDGTFVNAEIIKQGFGFAYTKYPFKYLEEFRKLERDARSNRRGLWEKRSET